MRAPRPSTDPAPQTPPADQSAEDALYTRYVREKVQAGLDSLARDGGIPHDRIRAELAKWHQR